MIYEQPRYLYSGDQYLTVEIGDEMTLAANFNVIGLDRAINEAGITGFIETFPGWRSLLLHYDSLAIRTEDLISELEKVVQAVPEVKEVPSRLIDLPVKYGGRWGSDLDFVAKENGISPEEVIRVHSETIHWVGMVGFTPGSPQLMQLNPPLLLSVRKYKSPRIYTPTGCIALGGSITAIYPVVSPGGYQMMGLTPVPIYDRFQSLEIFEESPVLLRIGDRIRFVCVEDDEFDFIRQQVWECSYKYNIEEGTFSL
jgi:KipI family sensor histidine kinase inhibitor